MHPYLGLFGGHLPSYVVCALAGLTAAAIALMVLLSSRDALHGHLGCHVAALPGVLVGGRLFGVLSAALGQVARGEPLDFEVAAAGSGIVYWGGLLGYLGLLRLMHHVRRLPFSIAAEAVGVCIPLFHAFGRMGCYLAGCCYGIESPVLSLPYRSAPDAPLVGRVPVQLIEAGFEALLFAALLALWLRRFHAGKPAAPAPSLLALYLGAYTAFRFCIEFLRGDAVRGVYGGVSFSQLVCAGVALCLVGSVLGRRKAVDGAGQRFVSGGKDELA